MPVIHTVAATQLTSQVSLAALFEEAKLAAEATYSPYSQFPVGAALLFDTHEVVRGCNVENASFGLTNCAERTALFSATVSGILRRSIPVAMAVWAKNTETHGISPCGACRQVLLELLPAQVLVYSYADTANTQATAWRVDELLPYSFGATTLASILG